MPKVQKHRTDETKHVVDFSRMELEDILYEKAMKVAGVDPDTYPSRIKSEIKIEDNMEGSPQYKSGTKARVTITISHQEEQV